jgi:membrane protein DedA with SNARE-associated domain
MQAARERIEGDTVSFVHEAFSLIEPYVRQYGLVAIFAIIYLESLGAPLPGESTLIAGSVLAARGDVPMAGLFLVAWIAAMLGDSTGYAIGRFGGRPLLKRYGWIVRLTPARLAELERLFRRRGPIIVVGARFVVVLRQLNGLVAGSVAMRWRRFAIANTLGAALWAAAWTVGPYLLGDLFGLDAKLR